MKQTETHQGNTLRKKHVRELRMEHRRQEREHMCNSWDKKEQWSNRVCQAYKGKEFRQRLRPKIPSQPPYHPLTLVLSG